MCMEHLLVTQIIRIGTIMKGWIFKMVYEKVSPELNFVDREKQVEKFWKENDIFEKSIENRKEGETYTFYDGPPTANGKPHIGHVLTRVIKDMIPRYRTMKGYMVPRKAGWDTHGLPVELEVEKKLGLDGKEQIEEYGLEPFIKHAVSSALTMTANGANGQTKDEMEKVLGSGMPLDELNKYLSSFSGSLTSGEDFKLKNANSIWFIKDNNFNVNNEFLQTNADFYHAEIYKRAYNSEIVNDINNWVSEHTDGMIDKLLDNGDALSNIALINATAFDAKWENYYYDNFVEDGTFTDANGNEQSVTMLISEESEYINGDNCTGFIKKYKGGKYGFAAILPDSNVSISDFVGLLNGDKLFKMLQNAESTNVVAKMPKFEYEYSAELSEALKALGMPTAFSDSADFSGISGDKLLISDVLHKTKISVTDEGTLSLAATGVVMSAAPDGDKQVILNRPFMYMILDNETMLPLFAGVYTGI